MKKNNKNLILILIFLSSFFMINGALVRSEEKRDVSLTVYYQNIALVKEKRIFHLKKGINDINFDQVSSKIYPTSVYFESISSPDKCFLLEQSYEYDLINTNRLLAKYKGEEIQVVTQEGDLYSGTLLSYDTENIIISENTAIGPIEAVRRSNLKDIRFPGLLPDLLLRPTLVWKVSAEEEGNQVIEVSYLTRGISWHSEYVAILDRDDKSIKLGSWVSLDNRSGMDFPNVDLKLVAGEINLGGGRKIRPLFKASMKSMDKGTQFADEVLHDYHLYKLDRLVTIKDESTKQISLLAPREVLIEKFYRLDSRKAKGKVEVAFRFTNSKDNGPLPAGKFRVYKRMADDSMEFLGEDMIEHIPVDEEVEIRTGYAFDLVVERKVLSQKKISAKVHEVVYEITLRNRKEEDVTIEVKEHMAGFWELVEASHSEYMKDAGKIVFIMNVPANNEEVLTYTIHKKY